MGLLSTGMKVASVAGKFAAAHPIATSAVAVGGAKGAVDGPVTWGGKPKQKNPTIGGRIKGAVKEAGMGLAGVGIGTAIGHAIVKSDFGTGVLGGGGRIPLAKKDDKHDSKGRFATIVAGGVGATAGEYGGSKAAKALHGVFYSDSVGFKAHKESERRYNLAQADEHHKQSQLHARLAVTVEHKIDNFDPNGPKSQLDKLKDRYDHHVSKYNDHLERETHHRDEAARGLKIIDKLEENLAPSARRYRRVGGWGGAAVGGLAASALAAHYLNRDNVQKSAEYGFDGRVTPRLFHKPRLGPKRPRIRRPFHLGAASLRGENMRGLTASQINGSADFLKMEKRSVLDKTIGYHLEEHAFHLAEMNRATKSGDIVGKKTHQKLADAHAEAVHQLTTQGNQNFGKFDEWMGDDVLEKAGQKRPNAQERVGNYIGAAYFGSGAGLVAGHFGVPKVGRLASKAVVRTGMLGYKAAHHIDKFADKSLDRDNYKQAESRLKMANKAEAIGTKLVSFGNKIKFKPRAGVGAAAGLAGGLYLAHKVNNPVKKADGELNSIARKSLVELAKDMGGAGMASTGIFDRAFGVQGSPNPQPEAHVNPGNHFASGWHWPNGVPPSAPVASL